jgi:amino acid transporter
MADLDEREIMPLLFSTSPPASPLLHALASPRADKRTAPKTLATSSSNETGPSDAAVLPRTVDATLLPETSPLGRGLSWRSAYILVISRVIGSGIFATPGAIVREVGSVGLALTLWVVGAAAAACALAVALEYGSMLPRSGGDKVYLEFTYRRPRFLATTVISVLVVCLGLTASNCVVFSEYTLFALGVQEPSEGLRKGLAVGLLTVVTVVHGCFRKIGIRIQDALGWTKIGLVVFMIVSGLYVVVSGQRLDDPETLSPEGIWAGSNWNWGVMSTALFKVFYSFAGLDNANNVLNEVKDPVKTIRSVSLTALVTSCLLYLLINVAYFMVVPMTIIKSSGELVGALFFERVFGRDLGGIILPLAVALSAAGNVMVVAFAMVSLQAELKKKLISNWQSRHESSRKLLDKAFCHFLDFSLQQNPSIPRWGVSSSTLFPLYS